MVIDGSIVRKKIMIRSVECVTAAFLSNDTLSFGQRAATAAAAVG